MPAVLIDARIARLGGLLRHRVQFGLIELRDASSISRKLLSAAG